MGWNIEVFGESGPTRIGSGPNCGDGGGGGNGSGKGSPYSLSVQAHECG